MTLHVMLTSNVFRCALLLQTACSTQSNAPRDVNVTRGMKPAAPIYFKHHLTRRSRSSGRPILIGKRRGSKVATGDYIQASVMPEEAVYLYLGYCDGGEFALFPPVGSLRAEPGRETRIPPGDTGLQVQANSSSEVLYLILSKSELSLSSPDLTIKIASSGGAMEGDCAQDEGDGPARKTPRWQPTDLRSDTAIQVVRYEFEHEAATEPP